MQDTLNYQDIASSISPKTVIGLGESTHGTHEFFNAKVELIKHLVSEHAFNNFFLESIDDHCEAINRYVQTGEGLLESLVNKLFYVYRTQEVADLFSWFRANYDKYPTRVIGLDQRKYAQDYQENYDLSKWNLRDKRMAQVVIDKIDEGDHAKGVIWAHDAHISADAHEPESYKQITKQAPMGKNLRRHFGNNYYALSQLFGSGTFSAALIQESGESDNSTLISHHAPEASEYFWEHRLSQKYEQPVFLEGPGFNGLADGEEVHYARALGWGVKRSIMHDNVNVNYVNLSRAFDGILFFPEANSSHLLK